MPWKVLDIVNNTTLETARNQLEIGLQELLGTTRDRPRFSCQGIQKYRGLSPVFT